MDTNGPRRLVDNDLLDQRAKKTGLVWGSHSFPDGAESGEGPRHPGEIHLTGFEGFGLLTSFVEGGLLVRQFLLLGTELLEAGMGTAPEILLVGELRGLRCNVGLDGGGRRGEAEHALVPNLSRVAQRVDLLFFHRGLQCLVAFEPKTEQLKLAGIGKLWFYVEALGREVKMPHERPSIGVLLPSGERIPLLGFHAVRALSSAVNLQKGSSGSLRSARRLGYCE